MTSVRDRIRQLTSSPSAAFLKDCAANAAQQTEALPQAPTTPELRAPCGVESTELVDSPGAVAAHDAAARAERALRPVRSDAAALAAAADIAASPSGGSDGASAAAATPPAADLAVSAAAHASSGRSSPTDLPAKPRGYRPPFAGSTSQYRGRVRSMPPKQPAEAVFSRHSAPMPGSGATAALKADLAAAANGTVSAAQQLSSDSLQARSMPVAATEVALPSTSTNGTLPAPPSTYRGRQRSMAPGVHSFRAESDPSATIAAAALPAPSVLALGSLAREVTALPADAPAGGAAVAEVVAGAAESEAAHPATDEHAPPPSGAARSSAAVVRRSISGSVVGGRSLLGRGHVPVPLSPPATQVQQRHLTETPAHYRLLWANHRLCYSCS